jgi:sigma-B regulation protein RsbU (phosphoserine phosphatase)
MMKETPVILIVDDEPFNVDALEQELEDMGYATLSASNGMDGLKIIDEQQPDLILLDIMMPGMDGFEVLEEIKSDTTRQHIPVIIISAMSNMNSIIRGIEMGAEDYLPKPFDDVLLRARIGSALEKKRLRDLERALLQSLEKELEIGHQIQAGFLPDSLPETDGWSLDAFFRPAREVAGDFYDVFQLPDGKLSLILGDVADKGVGSALFMALYRSLLRSSLNNSMQLDDPGNKLIRGISHTNDYVCRTHEGALFVTLFAAILDLDSGDMYYVNAGHNPPVLIDAEKFDLLKPTGPMVGVFEGMEFQAGQASIQPGGHLVVFSDGLEDAKALDGELFGAERLVEYLVENQRSTNEVISHLDEFSAGSEQYDDLTIMIIRREA